LQRRDMASETGGALVTRALAEQVWPGETAVGKRVRPLMRDYPWHTVVGVIEDVRTEDLRRAPEPTVYFPYSDLAWSRSFFFAVRTQGPPEPLLPAIRDAVWALDADGPLASVASMEGLVADHMSRTSFTLTLVGVAAATALFLCAVGIYGVIAYTVRQRHFEIGVRMALGAAETDVANMVLRQGTRVAVAGLVVGLVAAFGLTRVLDSLLYDVSATDPMTYVAMAALLLGVAVLATYSPARRAARLDPLEGLRAE
jgi:putative ABC transport system permease protein